MKLTLSSLIALICTMLHFPLAAAPELKSDSETASAGYYRLSWQSDVSADFILEEATNPTFSQAKILYQGPDTATIVSGRADGTYYYRIRTVQDNTEAGWSSVSKVVVNHHPLSRAFMFFALGAIVFLATLSVVILGSKTHAQ